LPSEIGYDRLTLLRQWYDTPGTLADVGRNSYCNPVGPIVTILPLYILGYLFTEILIQIEEFRKFLGFTSVDVRIVLDKVIVNR
jgi:hypothetical protein